MEQMMQQTTSASSASVTPTTSASSTGSGNAGGLAHASTADSPHPGMMTTSDTPAVLPPRRRLVKSAARSELKREGLGGPPGFGGTPVNSPSPLTSSGVPVLQGTGISGMVGSPSLPGGFRDRERIPLRSASKEFTGDQAHGMGGPSKSGRSPHSNAGAMEARHLGRRPEVNMRRHEAGVAQKAAELKRAALLRLQTSNAPGYFKQFDSSHQNYLVPVIPVHFAVKQ